METNIKNQAQLIAELIHYGDTLESITSKDFWLTFEDNKETSSHYEYKDFRCDAWSFSTDGYDYYTYCYLINSGYDGFDSVSYVCRKKVMTQAERSSLRSIFLQ